MAEPVPEIVKDGEEGVHVTEKGDSTREGPIEVVKEEEKPAATGQEITYMTGSSFYVLFVAYVPPPSHLCKHIHAFLLMMMFQFEVLKYVSSSPTSKSLL